MVGIWNYEFRKNVKLCVKNFSYLIGTGVYNYRSLGVRHIRKLNMSRGGREGNNALCKNDGPVSLHMLNSHNIAGFVLSEPNVNLAVVKKLIELQVRILSNLFLDDTHIIHNITRHFWYLFISFIISGLFTIWLWFSDSYSIRSWQHWIGKISSEWRYSRSTWLHDGRFGK